MTFSENLRRLRKAKGFTQEGLALECGWKGQSRIANYEAPTGRKGSRKPDIDGVPVIAAALGVGVQELFGFPALASQDARPDRETLAAAIDVLKYLAQMQIGASAFLTDADAILAVYDEVAREPVQCLDLEAASKRMAAWLRSREGDKGTG